MQKSNIMRDALADFLGLLSHKAKNGEMTDDDVFVLYRAIHDAGGIRATVKDMAGYFHQSEDNIRHVIHRNFIPASERRVYYEFEPIRKNIPERWRDRASLPAD